MLASCDSSEEPEVYPIRFGQTDYTIRYATTARIGFVDGGGKYELAASNPEVLGEFYIDAENNSLVVRPSSVGESTLTITDEIAGTSVTLSFTVVDFYLSFKVFNIEGDNHNPYLSIGNEIRFIRDNENTRQMKIMWQNKMSYEVKCIASGWFDIERNESNIYTLNMALHSQRIEEMESFCYTYIKIRKKISYLQKSTIYKMVILYLSHRYKLEYSHSFHKCNNKQQQPASA